MRAILLCALTTGMVSAQGPAPGLQFEISTYAGGNAAVGLPQGLAADAAGNVYFSSLNSVFKLDRTGAITRVAGTLRAGYSGDGGPAVDAQLFMDDGESGWPSGLAVDGEGNLYIGDRGNARVRKVSADGIITTVAGNGQCCTPSGDGGPATSARLNTPIGLALDGEGNLFIADAAAHMVRKVAVDGTISTVAGGGIGRYSGDGGPATSAGLNYPTGLAVDGDGNLLIADVDRVRMVAADGTITTAAGNGGHGYSGDDGPATGAQISAIAIATDSDGNLYIADPANYRIRKVSASGIITTVAGNGSYVFSSEGDRATNTAISASGVAVAGDEVYVADLLNGRIRKFSPGGIMTTAASAVSCCYGGDGESAIKAQLNLYPWVGGMAVDGAGSLYIADTANLRVRKIQADGTITTVAGSGSPIGYSGDGGPATDAHLSFPTSVAVDQAGNLYIADTNNVRVRKVSPAGIITTVAGGGACRVSCDGGPATAVQLSYPRGLAVDSSGNLYFTNLATVRKVSPDGIITTVAGGGTDGRGDGGPATSAQLSQAWSLAVDGAGNLYIGDLNDHRVRKVSADGVITTVAGDGTAGDSGDGGAATSAQLSTPAALAVDGAGNLYIADTYNRRIRMVSVDGIITTVAGDGSTGYSGDGGPAPRAQFGLTSGLAIDGAGNLYVADQSYNAVRLLQAATAAPPPVHYSAVP